MHRRLTSAALGHRRRDGSQLRPGRGAGEDRAAARL